MQLHNLSKTTSKTLRRLGRGHGSARGKTAGRGTKGQKARTKVGLAFEGGALPLIKRLPLLRGKGRNRVFKKKPIVVNVDALSVFSPKSIVDIKSLIKHKVIKEDEAKLHGVKVLGEGDIKIPLNVKLSVSKGAILKIEKAGGSVEIS